MCVCLCVPYARVYHVMFEDKKEIDFSLDPVNISEAKNSKDQPNDNDRISIIRQSIKKIRKINLTNSKWSQVNCKHFKERRTVYLRRFFAIDMECRERMKIDSNRIRHSVILSDSKQCIRCTSRWKHIKIHSNNLHFWHLRCCRTLPFSCSSLEHCLNCLRETWQRRPMIPC